MGKKNYFSGYKGNDLFEGQDVFAFKNVERDDVLRKVYPILKNILKSLDSAFEYGHSDKKEHQLENYLIDRRFADNVYANFCANLNHIPGVQIYKDREIGWFRVEVDGIRLWVHKLDRKLRANSSSVIGQLRMCQKTNNNMDTRPLIILGYVADKQNEGYEGLYFTRQEGNRISWHIDVVDEINKQNTIITSSSLDDDEVENIVNLRKSAVSEKHSGTYNIK